MVICEVKDSLIENPGISFVGMTQLGTFVPRVYSKMMTSGGLFDRTLLVVNPNPSRLVPSVKAEKIADLNQYEEQDLRLVKSVQTCKYLSPSLQTPSSRSPLL